MGEKHEICPVCGYDAKWVDGDLICKNCERPSIDCVCNYPEERNEYPDNDAA